MGSINEGLEQFAPVIYVVRVRHRKKPTGVHSVIVESMLAQAANLSHVVQRLHSGTPIVPDAAVEDGRGDAPPSLTGEREGAAASAITHTEQALPVTARCVQNWISIQVAHNRLHPQVAQSLCT